MKKVFVVLGVTVLALTSCSKIFRKELSSEEKEDLQFLIQEEKLARDVYTYAYNKYGEVIFSNISSSEQKHMDRVEGLLDDYKLDNPNDGLSVGQFELVELQDLYNELIVTVDSSLVHAYKVGATIEDLDIFDISELENHTSNKDLLNVYSKLSCGSTNHIRSFVSSLTALNEEYNPQFISQEDYDYYISSENQRCGRN